MKKTYRLLIGALLTGFCLNFSSHAAVLDKIVAVVNDEVITRGEVDKRLIPIAQQLKTRYHDAKELQDALNEARVDVTEQLIDDKLILSEAKRMKIEVSDKEINGQIASVKKRFDTEREFISALRSQGLTLSELKKNYRVSIMGKKLMDMEIGAKINITPAEIFEYYKAHKSEFTIPTKVHVRMITIKYGKERTQDEALEIARDVMVKLRSGEDFAKLAMLYSEDPYSAKGGDMGFVGKGDMMKRIDDVIFTLPVGQVSEVIGTDLGFHIFRVEEEKEAEYMDLNTASPEIERKLYSDKYRERAEEFISKLREKAYIEIK